MIAWLEAERRPVVSVQDVATVFPWPRTAIHDVLGRLAHKGWLWNAKTRTFTLPKYGPYTLALVDHAREALLGLKRDELAATSPFVFTTLRGTHYTPSSRTHHWNRVRAAAGLGHTTLYLATRHYFGWYATNVLELPPDVVAQQLGHKDGGKLVAQLYGHLEGRVARRRIRAAFAATGQVKPTCRGQGHRLSGAPPPTGPPTMGVPMR